MKCSLGISNFLEEISSLSHSIVFLYFFALIAEEGFLFFFFIFWWRRRVGIIVSGILFGALNAGGVKMQLLAKVPSASIYMIQGMIIIFAVSRELFIWFGRKLQKEKAHGVTGGENHG